MESGKVVSLFLGETIGGPMRPVGEVHAVAGAGIEGDRFWQGAGSTVRKRGPDREITLIESEALDALNRVEKIPLDPSECRRNVVTRGVALNHLVGRDFRVGGATLRGLRLCEPCKHLESLTRPGVMLGLLHRGGLRAQILEGGVIRPDDDVRAS